MNTIKNYCGKNEVDFFSFRFMIFFKGDSYYQYLQRISSNKTYAHLNIYVREIIMLV